MTPLNPTTILEKIFASEFFSATDKTALVQQYDTSSALRSANANPEVMTTPVVQTAADITHIPAEGILINKSGHYRFSNDIIWEPANSSAAITIQADNVELDLQGYTLHAHVPTIERNYVGVSITKGIKISVRNGIIKDLSYYGLSATQVLDLRVEDVIVDGMAYKNTKTKNVTPCGIFIDKSIGFRVNNCEVRDISVTAPSCAGIQIVESFDGTVSACRLAHLQNKDGAVQGFSYLLCSDIKTIGCDCSFFQSHYLGETTTTGHTVLGYIPIFCIGLKYDNCNSTGMTGCCDDCHGMSVFLDALVEVNNFTAKDVTDGVTPRNTGAKATGLEVYGVGITLNNCIVENIKAIVPQDRQSTGFSACGEFITFNNCTAKNVIVTNAAQQPSTKYGYGAGFGWAPDPRPPFKNWPAHRVTYNNCSAIDCQLGFDTWFHTHSKWEQPVATGCEIFILEEPYGTPRTLSIDKCSESPSGNPEQTTITNVAANNTYPQVVIAMES